MRARKRGRFLLPIAAALLVAALFKTFVADVALVEGRSMLPTLHQGQVVVVLRCAYGLRLPPAWGGWILRCSLPRPGDLVVAENPRTGIPVVKRVDRLVPPAGTVAAESRERGVFIIGDNPSESIDSRSYGPVSLDAIAGRVLGHGEGP